MTYLTGSCCATRTRNAAAKSSHDEANVSLSFPCSNIRMARLETAGRHDVSAPVSVGVKQPPVLLIQPSQTTFQTTNMKTGDAIAKTVLDNFDTWERKRKPLDRSTQKDDKCPEKERPREWVPLSGIVAQSWVLG